MRMWRTLAADARAALLVRSLHAGAQAVVAWVMQRADPSVKLSMVAEEDAEDLK